MPNQINIDPSWLAREFPDLQGLQVLAAGGQKQVYSATHPTDGEVVLKLMHVGSDPARTERELEAISRVQAPRMPRIFAHGQATHQVGTIVWFREQRVPGQALDKRIQTGPLLHEDVLRLALHVSETLVAAENVNIVHRDVKPANIIAAPDGYWLIDFGIARHLDLVSLTPTAAPGGLFTPGYAPIEQCRNDKPEIDARADLFALGVTLYEAATGTNPHRANTIDPHEMIRRAASMALPRLTPPFPAAFADLVTTLSQPDPVHRVRTASEANEWIKDICDREGVQ